MKGWTQILGGILWLAAFAAIPARAATISVYISPPKVQYSEVTGVTVSNFDSMGIGLKTGVVTSLIGTYNATTSAPFEVVAADEFGGATDPTNPSTPTKYFSIGAQSGTSSPVSLTLDQPASYFGFWMSAVDLNNGVSFYSGNYLLARFDSRALLTLLNNNKGKITAIDNKTRYSTSEYFADPNSGQNKSEPYAFVDFVATGIKFDKIVFDNSKSMGTGFESDNHTIMSSSVTMSGDHVFVEDLSADIPEPAAGVLLAGGLLLIAAARRRGLGALPPR